VDSFIIPYSPLRAPIEKVEGGEITGMVVVVVEFAGDEVLSR
jgi:hypothetical protein